MGKGSPRCGRVSDLLHREISKIISSDFSAPKYGMITVSGVNVSEDLTFARVYVTVLQDGKEEHSVDALNNAATFFRTEMSKTLKLRVVPKMKFYFDESLKTGTRMDQLLDSVKDQSNNEDI